jgi:ketosteroid isomerase-like protein
VAGDDVERIRRMYRLWNDRDLDTAFELLAPEVEVVGHPELPDPGPVHGREQAKAWLSGLLEAWDEVVVEPERFIDAGEQVVVIFHVRGRGRGSGIEVTSGRDAHVWTLEGGRIVAIRWYQGTADALRDTGVD